MKLKSGYVPIESPAPFMGLNSTLPPERIANNLSPELKNVIVRDGIVSRRPGSDQLGQRLCGRVLAIAQFGPLGEDTFTVVLTSLRQYAYNPTTKVFVDLTPGKVSYAITAISLLNNTFTIAGDHVAAFPADKVFSVDAGPNIGAYTVTSSSLVTGNTVIVVSETIPSATTGHNIVLATDLTTTATDLIDYAVLTDINSHRFLMTNGVDTPRTWDGDLTHDFANWSPTYPGFVTCRRLAVFSEHLFLGWVTTGADEPQTIAWSNAGDFNEFVAGDAGAQILYQLNDGIRCLKTLGDRLVVYATDTIMAGIYVGLPVVFAFEVIIPEGVRLVSGNGVTSINVGHVYASAENFYLFDGTRGLRVLGESIYREYKDTKDHSLLERVAVFNDYAKRTMYFAIPDLSGGTTIYTAFYDVFNLGSIVWAKEALYVGNLTCWGFFLNRSEAVTWEDTSWEPPGTLWGEEIGPWANEGEQLNFPIRAYGTLDGRVMISTESTWWDRQIGGYQIYMTKDFVLPELDQSIISRWLEIEFEAWGSQVNVLVSADKGHTWKGLQTVPLSEAPTTYRVPCDVIGRTLRVQFISSGSIWTLRWVRAWAKPGGPA